MSAASLSDAIAADARLYILRELASQPNACFSDRQLTCMLERSMVSRSREWVRAQLLALSDARFINVHEQGELLVARMAAPVDECFIDRAHRERFCSHDTRDMSFAVSAIDGAMSHVASILHLIANHGDDPEFDFDKLYALVRGATAIIESMGPALSYISANAREARATDPVPSEAHTARSGGKGQRAA